MMASVHTVVAEKIRGAVSFSVKMVCLENDIQPDVVDNVKEMHKRWN